MIKISVFFDSSNPSGAAFLRSGAASLRSGAVSLRSGAVSLRSGAVSLRSGAAPLRSGAAPLRSGAAPLRSGALLLGSCACVYACLGGPGVPLGIAQRLRRCTAPCTRLPLGLFFCSIFTFFCKLAVVGRGVHGFNIIATPDARTLYNLKHHYNSVILSFWCLRRRQKMIINRESESWER